jgi:hypothetical protein
MLNRIVRAIKLDKLLFREVAQNDSYLKESFLIVLFVAIVSALGNTINSNRPVFSFLAEITNSIFFGWILWSVIAFFIGTAFFNGDSTINTLLRTIGYASAPRLLSFFGFIPCIGWLIGLAGAILSLIAVVIAIREAMHFEIEKALITALIGFILFLMTSAAIRIVLTGLSLPFLSFFS